MTSKMSAQPEKNYQPQNLPTSGWSSSAILRVVLLLLSVAAVLWIIYKLRTIILLLMLSIFFAYLIAPFVKIFCRPIQAMGYKFQIPRTLAIAVAYLILFGSLTVAAIFFIPQLDQQIVDMARQLPNYLASLQNRLGSLNYIYIHIAPILQESFHNTLAQIGSIAGDFLRNMLVSIFGAVAYLPWLALVPIIAFFILKDVEYISRYLLQTLPSGDLRWRGANFFQDVNSALAAYVRAQLFACLLVGALCAIGFAIIGVPFPLAFATMAGLLELIPLVGPFTAALITIFFTGLHSLFAAGMALLFLVILRVCEDYIIYPRIIRVEVHLHPLGVVIAILCGAELAGVMGVILAIPIVAIISISYRHWLDYRGNRSLLADFLNDLKGK
jgi:predicted PurR-regulated permease PerM